MNRITIAVILVTCELTLNTAPAGATDATDALLYISTIPDSGNPSTGTWTVSASLGSNPDGDLGLTSFSLDVDGLGGVSIQKASPVSSTNQSPNPPFTLFRSTGTISGQNLLAITAAQDIVTAAQNFDSTILGFGYGLLAPVSSPVYGLIAALGPVTLATGRYTENSFGSITASVSQAPSSPFFRRTTLLMTEPAPAIRRRQEQLKTR